MIKQQAKDQAEVEAASAADTAAEVATGGLVRGRACRRLRRSKLRSTPPIMSGSSRKPSPWRIGQMAGFSSDFAQQLQSNPRLARLTQLADSKHCKGGGREPHRLRCVSEAKLPCRGWGRRRHGCLMSVSAVAACVSKKTVVDAFRLATALPGRARPERTECSVPRDLMRRASYVGRPGKPLLPSARSVRQGASVRR